MDIALTYQSICVNSRRLGCWKESLIDSEVPSRMTSAQRVDNEHKWASLFEGSRVPMVNMFVSAKCARALFNEKVFTLVNIDGAALFFSGCHTRADHYAERFAQFNRLSLRANSRWPAHARESRAAMDRPRPRFNSDEYLDTSLRNHYHAQDTCVRNAPFAVSVEL
jgi:hypothetical protein